MDEDGIGDCLLDASCLLLFASWMSPASFLLPSASCHLPPGCLCQSVGELQDAHAHQHEEDDEEGELGRDDIPVGHPAPVATPLS